MVKLKDGRLDRPADRTESFIQKCKAEISSDWISSTESGKLPSLSSVLPCEIGPIYFANCHFSIRNAGNKDP